MTYQLKQAHQTIPLTIFAGLICFGIFLVGPSLVNDSFPIWLGVLIGILPFAGVTAYAISRDRWIKSRTSAAIKFVKDRDFTASRAFSFEQLSWTILELGDRDRLFTTIAQGKDWTFGDYSYVVYGKTRSGEYRDKLIFYSVIIFDLPRSLPNVVFDSKKMRGKQLRKIFDKHQQHSLEGTFDNYFTTYFPPMYTIDSLSFITPEVMEALIDASGYDIEIEVNKLFLYDILRKMPDQLEDIVQKGENVRKKLLNNIVTYRDERLDLSDGRQRVSLLGQELFRNLQKYIVTAIIGLGVFTSTIAVWILYGTFSEGYAIYGAIIFIVSLRTYIKKKRAQTKLLNMYKK